MKSYKMTVSLATPVVFNTLNPLDANIAGMLFGGRTVPDETIDATLRELFEFHEDGFPMASLPVMTDVSPLMTVFAGNFDRQLSGERRALESKIPLSDLSSRADRYRMPTFIKDTSMVHWPTRELTYYVRGDIRAIKKVMIRSGSIGARISHGQGTIEEIYFSDATHDLCGILDPEGNLVRPIPVGLAEKLGVTGIRVLRPYSVPYAPRHRSEKNLDIPVSVVPEFAQTVL